MASKAPLHQIVYHASVPYDLPPWLNKWLESRHRTLHEAECCISNLQLARKMLAWLSEPDRDELVENTFQRRRRELDPMAAAVSDLSAAGLELNRVIDKVRSTTSATGAPPVPPTTCRRCPASICAHHPGQPAPDAPKPTEPSETDFGSCEVYQALLIQLYAMVSGALAREGTWTNYIGHTEPSSRARENPLECLLDAQNLGHILRTAAYDVLKLNQQDRARHFLAIAILWDLWEDPKPGSIEHLLRELDNDMLAALLSMSASYLAYLKCTSRPLLYSYELRGCRTSIATEFIERFQLAWNLRKSAETVISAEVFLAKYWLSLAGYWEILIIKRRVSNIPLRQPSAQQLLDCRDKSLFTELLRIDPATELKLAKRTSELLDCKGCLRKGV